MIKYFKIKINLFRERKGFTLVEILIYLALMVTIALAVSQSLIAVLKSNRSAFADINLRNSGYSAMEGMIREIRAAQIVDQASGGVLQVEQNNGGNIVKFATSSNLTLNFYEGASSTVLVGPLTSKGVSVENLNFIQINTGKSTAIKIEMKLQTTTQGITKSAWFYDTAILRGSY